MDFEKISPGRVDESWNWNKNLRDNFPAHINPGGVAAVVSFTAGKEFPLGVAALPTAGEEISWVWGSSGYFGSTNILIFTTGKYWGTNLAVSQPDSSSSCCLGPTSMVSSKEILEIESSFCLLIPEQLSPLKVFLFLEIHYNAMVGEICQAN